MAHYDFCGYATRNDIRCADGRTIRRNAFVGNDGQTVPLVWNHRHDGPSNVLGHALLENREDGVYAYCSFNNSADAQDAKIRVQHGDIRQMSIYANGLKQTSTGDVVHGTIREVSLVLSGANPGAFIQALDIQHSGDPEFEEEFSADIFTGEDFSLVHSDEEDEDMDEGKTVQDVFDELTDEQKQVVYYLIGEAVKDAEGEVQHAATDADEDYDDEEDTDMANDKTVQDVFDELTDEQKKVVYYIIGEAVQDAQEEAEEDDEEYDDEEYDDEEMEQAYYGEDEEDYLMHSNVFEDDYDQDFLMHADAFFDNSEEIFKDAKRMGSLKEAVIEHAATYGIDDIDYLFPDARTLTDEPEFIRRSAEWVNVFMDAVHKSPFSRIKSIFADITEAEARARGYIKGNLKKDEVISLLKRVTNPTTIYKKQKIDRNDILDITDFDVIAWMKQEMRWMLDEEVARAALIGDGRSAGDDKIDELCIRPIWTDADLYTIKTVVTEQASWSQSEDAKAKDLIRAIVKARKDYRGSGNPIFFTTEEVLTDMLLAEDSIGRPLYDTVDKLATKLRVSKVVTVEVMNNQTRLDTTDNKTHTLIGIIVNPEDYNFGSDKGGEISLFDDFDIDYNQQKYLIETRLSGALVKPKSAIAIETVPASDGNP